MQKSYYGLVLFLPLIYGCTEAQLFETIDRGMAVSREASQIPQQKYSSAIKEALELSANRASALLSQEGGYSASKTYRIGMPAQMQAIAQTLRRFGLSKQLDEIELRMNRGAEQAANEAKTVFISAIQSMTVTDALSIIRGNQTAATTYFRNNTEQSLRRRYLPIVQQNLNKVGFYGQYKRFLAVYETLPVTGKVDLDLEEHVLNRSLDGLFAQIAAEEILIRKNPLQHGTSLLNVVFSKAQ